MPPLSENPIIIDVDDYDRAKRVIVSLESVSKYDFYVQTNPPRNKPTVSRIRSHQRIAKADLLVIQKLAEYAVETDKRTYKP